MPEYAQKVAKRTGGADGARGLTPPTSHATVSAAGTDGGPAGTLQALLNEAPAVQAVTQMKGALNRRGSSLQVAQSKAAFDDAPVDVAQGRFETVQREQGVEEAECPPGLTGLDMVHASLNRAPLVERTTQLRRSLNQSLRVAQLAVLSGAVGRSAGAGSSVALRPATAGLVIQQKALVKDKLNVAGEYHPESGKRRDQEAAYTTEKTGGGYYKEGEFKTSKWVWQSDRLGDPMLLRAEMLLAILREKMVAQILTPFSANQVPPALGLNIPIEQAWDVVKGSLQSQLQEIATAIYRALDEKTEVEQAVKAATTFERLRNLSGAMPLSVVKDVGSDILPEIKRIIAGFARDVLGLGDIRPESTVNQLRSKAMQEAAANNSERTIGEKKGVWKVGNDHIGEIKADKNTAKYELMTKDEFNEDFVPWVQLKYPEWFYTTFTVPAVKTAVQGLGAVLDKYPDRYWSVTPEDRQGALEGLTKLKDAWNGIKDEDRRSNAGIVITALDRYFMTVDRRRPSQEVMWEEKGFTKPPK